MLRWLADNLEELLGALLMGAMLAVVAVGVFFRYVLAAPFQWMEEVAMGLFVWLVFVSAATGCKQGMHVAVDLFVDLLPPRARRAVAVLVYLTVLASLAGFVVLGWSYADKSWGSYTSALRLPKFWINLSIPVGSGLMFARTATRLVAELQGAGPVSRVEPARTEVV